MSSPGTSGPGDDGPDGPRRPRNFLEAIMMAARWFEERRGAEGSEGQKEGPPSRRPIGVIFAAVVVLGLLVLLAVLAVLWTDYLWYSDLGFSGIFLTRIWAWLAVAAAGGAFFFLLFYGNLYIARRFSPRIRIADRQGSDDVLELVTTEGSGTRWMILGVSLFFTVIFAVSAAGSWEQILLYFNQASFGWSDPIFDRDASFYVYTLPFARSILSFVGIALLLSLIGVVVVYVLARAVYVDESNRPMLAPHVKGHLSILAAFLLAARAVDYFFSRWELVFSDRGATFGASYTDVHAQLPVLMVLAVVSLIAAGIFLVNIHYKGWKLPAGALVLLVLTWLLAGQIYPALVQQYEVSPNEIDRESPYISYNIDATRTAFGLDEVQSRNFPAEEQLDMEALEDYQATIDNVRLWDPRPLLDTYRQLQEIRLYYSFVDVDVDRYEVDGDYRQVMLSTRELDQGKLQERSRTWVNQHLVYTHGYGLTMSPVNEVTSEGLPELLIQDIPPRGESDLEVKKPGVYYGEVGSEFVLVQTDQQEFDYPQQDENVFTSYDGRGGVELSSFPRRASFALRFNTLRLLLSDDLTDESRIMFHRTVRERVREIAPFLRFDRDPYMVLRDDGTLAWILDAYTASSRFPYSEPRPDGMNYLRNSIKVVVDAYDGDVTFYQIDSDDAVANAWGNLYPELLTPGDELPEDLRRHLRYPEDLFSIQAEVLSIYHMTDPREFYNKEDVWEIPTEQYAGQEIPVVPYYVIMALPGETNEEFVLIQPMTPLTRNNMIAWMAGRMDGEHYGELAVYEFPKEKLIYGPSQIEARISNHPEISAQVTLWDQAGSRVIRGNLLVIPVGDALIYVEPLYLQAEQSPIPELARVIVSYEDMIVMEEDLETALEMLFTGEAAEVPPPPDVEPPEGETTTTTLETTTTVPDLTTTTAPRATTTTAPDITTTTAPGAPDTTVPGDREALIRQAQQHYEQAVEAQRSGDWAEYGRQIEELGRILQTLAETSAP